ncbi:mitochondrial carrier domain-containing protein [Mrakia frigida]|uniref:mitochondrial carrier domain-containing protein n=1 Tax=Mrakia frigida TaxID=29902 RepID=UPI003FCC12DC
MDYFFCPSPLVFYCKQDKTCCLSSSRLKKPIEPSELLEIVELELTFSFPFNHLSTLSPFPFKNRLSAGELAGPHQIFKSGNSDKRADPSDHRSPSLPSALSPPPSPSTSHLPPSPMSSIQTASASTPPSSNVRLVGFAAGVCSGLTKLSVGHPFDTIKTRMQCAPLGTYRGAVDCLLQTVRREGPLALYKGASPPAVGWMMSDSVLLGSLHNYRIILLEHGFGEANGEGRRLSVLGHTVAGMLAGFSKLVRVLEVSLFLLEGVTNLLHPFRFHSSFIAHPIELLKAKLQLQLAPTALSLYSSSSAASSSPPVKKQFSGPIDCAKQVVREQGVLGLYRGFAASLAFRANFAWMFGGYEIFMRSFAKLDSTPYALSLPTQTFLAGGLGANFFWLGALPADNVKNRIMTDSLTSPRYTGLPSVVRAIWKEAGWKGFYRGFVPVVLRAFPTNASALFVYEGVMRYSGAEKTRS